MKISAPQVYFSEIMTDKYWLIRLDRCRGCPLSRCFLSVLSHRGYMLMPVAYVGTYRLDVRVTMWYHFVYCRPSQSYISREISYIDVCICSVAVVKSSMRPKINIPCRQPGYDIFPALGFSLSPPLSLSPSLLISPYLQVNAMSIQSFYVYLN